MTRPTFTYWTQIPARFYLAGSNSYYVFKGHAVVKRTDGGGFVTYNVPNGYLVEKPTVLNETRPTSEGFSVQRVYGPSAQPWAPVGTEKWVPTNLPIATQGGQILSMSISYIPTPPKPYHYYYYNYYRDPESVSRVTIPYFKETEGPAVPDPTGTLVQFTSALFALTFSTETIAALSITLGKEAINIASCSGL